MASDDYTAQCPWIDPEYHVRPAAWFQLYDRTGRLMGMFYSLPEVRRWLRDRPPSQRFRLVFFYDGRPLQRWACRSAFGGQVKSFEFKRGVGR